MTTRSLFPATPALSDPAGSVGGPASDLLMETMTWPEIRARIDAGDRTVIVPCGAIEQHGPHLPLAVDADHASHLALGVAARLGRVLVAPTLRIGCSPHHMAFAGTVTLSEPTFEAMYRDVCTSLARHGFDRILIFSGHGGNFAPLGRIAPRLQEAVGDGCRVLAFTDLIAFLDVWRGAVTDAGLPVEHVGGHADVAETSVYLALRPTLVRASLAAAGYVGEINEEVIARIMADGFDSVSHNGVIGDPEGANAALGRRCIDAMVDLLAGWFQDQLAAAGGARAVHT